MEPSEKLLYTRMEAAEMLSLSVATIDVAIARGMLRARRAGRRVLIEKREIEKFSRADHPRIWDSQGNRGSDVTGRNCVDCAKRARALLGARQKEVPTPAVRFFSRLPLCAACFDARKGAAQVPGEGSLGMGLSR